MTAKKLNSLALDVYPLPEAQLDRFMMKIIVNHNSEDEELEIMRKSATKSFGEIESVLDIEEIKILYFNYLYL